MFTGWPLVGDAVMGLLPERVGAPVNDVVDEMAYAAAGQAYLEWVTYRDAAELHTQLVEPEMVTDTRMLDAMTLCAARIATRMSLSQNAAEGLLYRAIVLRDRLPQVFECLKNGQVSPRHIRTIVSRTELIDGQDYAADVDAAIAESLRKRGSWSEQRMRDMIDRIVYRHDPDAVREQRKRAKDDRNFWLERGEHGMAELGATMTAETALLVYQRVCELAEQVCTEDGRTQAQRRSDASFALNMGAEWECLCGSDTCTAAVIADTASNEPADGFAGDATAPEPADSTTEPADDAGPEGGTTGGSDRGSSPSSPQGQPASPASAPTTGTGHCHSHPTGNRRQRRAAAKLTKRLHAYTDAETAAGLAQHPGFLDGYGVISSDHVRDLLTNPGVRVHVMGNKFDATGTVIPQPCTQPADPYRPSTALQTFVRARDQYCMWPGCNRPASKADLDHATEYDHANPAAGGQTSPRGLAALCRFHHLIKTFSTFLTDLVIGPDKRIHTTVTTPEGLTVDGPVHTGEDLHPGLTDIEFAEPPNAPPRQPEEQDEPTRRRTRLADKYAHRRQERERNRQRREDAINDEPEPPF